MPVNKCFMFYFGISFRERTQSDLIHFEGSIRRFIKKGRYLSGECGIKYYYYSSWKEKVHKSTVGYFGWVRIILKMENIFGNVCAMVMFYISQYYIEKTLCKYGFVFIKIGLFRVDYIWFCCQKYTIWFTMQV